GGPADVRGREEVATVHSKNTPHVLKVDVGAGLVHEPGSAPAAEPPPLPGNVESEQSALAEASKATSSTPASIRPAWLMEASYLYCNANDVIASEVAVDPPGSDALILVPETALDTLKSTSVSLSRATSSDCQQRDRAAPEDLVTKQQSAQAGAATTAAVTFRSNPISVYIFEKAHPRDPLVPSVRGDRLVIKAPKRMSHPLQTESGAFLDVPIVLVTLKLKKNQNLGRTRPSKIGSTISGVFRRSVSANARDKVHSERRSVSAPRGKSRYDGELVSDFASSLPPTKNMTGDRASNASSSSSSQARRLQPHRSFPQLPVDSALLRSSSPEGPPQVAHDAEGKDRGGTPSPPSGDRPRHALEFDARDRPYQFGTFKVGVGFDPHEERLDTQPADRKVIFKLVTPSKEVVMFTKSTGDFRSFKQLIEENRSRVIAGYTDPALDVSSSDEAIPGALPTSGRGVLEHLHSLDESNHICGACGLRHPEWAQENYSVRSFHYDVSVYKDVESLTYQLVYTAVNSTATHELRQLSEKGLIATPPLLSEFAVPYRARRSRSLSSIASSRKDAQLTAAASPDTDHSGPIRRHNHHGSQSKPTDIGTAAAGGPGLPPSVLLIEPAPSSSPTLHGHHLHYHEAVVRRPGDHSRSSSASSAITLGRFRGLGGLWRDPAAAASPAGGSGSLFASSTPSSSPRMALATLLETAVGGAAPSPSQQLDRLQHWGPRRPSLPGLISRGSPTLAATASPTATQGGASSGGGEQQVATVAATHFTQLPSSPEPLADTHGYLSDASSAGTWLQSSSSSRRQSSSAPDSPDPLRTLSPLPASKRGEGGAAAAGGVGRSRVPRQQQQKQQQRQRGAVRARSRPGWPERIPAATTAAATASASPLSPVTAISAHRKSSSSPANLEGGGSGCGTLDVAPPRCTSDSDVTTGGVGVQPADVSRAAGGPPRVTRQAAQTSVEAGTRVLRAFLLRVSGGGGGTGAGAGAGAGL
ncbi:hypothetical protein HK405_008825, partial [Cladochytrium tenue]